METKGGAGNFIVVPSLEHNNKITGESLDLLNYLDNHFEGPALLPDEPAKREFAKELLSYTEKWMTTIFCSFKVDPLFLLKSLGLIDASDKYIIIRGLDQIEKEIEMGKFKWRTDREDVHMNIEAALTDLVGEPAKKLMMSIFH